MTRPDAELTLDAFLANQAAPEASQVQTGPQPAGPGHAAADASESSAGPGCAPLFLEGDAANAAAQAPARPPPSARQIIVALALDEALGTRGRAHLLGNGSAVILIRVPSTAWIPPVEAMLFERYKNISVISVSPGRRRDPDERNPDFIRAVSQGSATVGLSTDAALLPSAMRAAADHSYVVQPPDHALVARAIRRWSGRRSPRLTGQDLRGLDLPDLCAALRPHSGPGEIVHRLRRASAQRCGVEGGDETPLLKDLVGYGAAGAWAEELVADVERLRAGEIRNLPSAIFAGPPGTGKTSLARSIARSANLPYFTTSVAEWLVNGPGFLDSVLKQQVEFFSNLMQQQCIGFIDELDALPNRATLSSRGSDWWTPVVTGLLINIDRLRAHRPDSIILAATNHLAHIDKALLRPGRFDYTFEIGPPDEEALAQILRQHLGSDLAGIDLASVARLGVGGTGADALGWVARARQRARSEGRRLQIDDLSEAVAPPDRRPAAALRGVALHEAGHAVVAMRLGLRVERVSIQQIDASAGCTEIHSDRLCPTLPDLAAQIVGILAGRAADMRLGAGADAGSLSDLQQATTIAVAARASCGLGGSLVFRGMPQDAPQLLANDPDLGHAVEADLRAALAEASRRVEADACAIRAVADALLRCRVMTGREVEALIAIHPPSRPVGPIAPRGT